MPPIVAFIIGAVTLEIIKFGVWLCAKPGAWRPSQFEYLKIQAGHFVVLVGGGALFCVAWSMNGLDLITSYLPDWLTSAWGCGADEAGCTAAPGIPYTPQVGLWFGVAMAFQGVNKILAAFKTRFGPGKVESEPVP